MTSFRVQKRAKPHPTQPVCQSIKSLAALGVDFKTSSTLVLEISKMSFMLQRISFFPRVVFALAQISEWLFSQAVSNTYQIVRLQNFDPLPAGFEDAFSLPVAEQTADSVKRGPGHLCHILPREG